jgi:hypothetical protein
MRDRLDAIGGTLAVQARPGVGVHLLGQVPATRMKSEVKFLSVPLPTTTSGNP